MSLIMNKIAKISQSSTSNIIGRIGGNIPSSLVNKKELEEYNFYVSFQNPENLNEYISIFVPKDYDKMIDNNIYPNCSIKVFSTVFSEESQNTYYTIGYIKKSAIIGYEEVKSDEYDFVTITKIPQLIQDENYYLEDLEKDNYSFFLQIDENFYPEDLINGNYILGYGALYLYKHNITGEIIAGFWQYS